MLHLVVRIVGEGEDREFPNIVVESQISRQDFLKRIKDVTNVPMDCLDVYLNDDKIPDSLHPLETAKHNDEIRVKHTSLPQWTALTETVKTFSSSKDPEQKKRHFQLANDIIKSLVDSKIFVSYVSLNLSYLKIQQTLFKYYDRTPEAMENSLKSFFKKLLKGKNPNFTFEDKTAGTRAGKICKISYENVIEKYYLKTNHDAGRSGSPSRTDLDIREIFIYRFLQLLGIGATIHFSTGVMGSKSILYIASKEIPEFKTFGEVEETETEHRKYANPAIHILTIFSVLSIGDCHTWNVGVNDQMSAYIVDFSLDHSGIQSMKKDFRNHIRGCNQINKQVDTYTFHERVKIGVAFLKSIQFKEKINEAVEHFMVNDKKVFDEENLHFPASTNDDFEEYIKVVKKNLKTFLAYSKEEEEKKKEEEEEKRKDEEKRKEDEKEKEKEEAEKKKKEEEEEEEKKKKEEDEKKKKEEAEKKKKQEEEEEEKKKKEEDEKKKKEEAEKKKKQEGDEEKKKIEEEMKKNESQRNGPKPHLTIEPSGNLIFKAESTSQTRVTFKNVHTKKIMFKIKFSDNAYQSNPVFGTIEPGKTVDIVVTHNKSPHKEAKMVIVNSNFVGEMDLAKSFKSVRPTGGQITVKLVAN